jgi:hypothetical protein
LGEISPLGKIPDSSKLELSFEIFCLFFNHFLINYLSEGFSCNDHNGQCVNFGTFWSFPETSLAALLGSNVSQVLNRMNNQEPAEISDFRQAEARTR